jgi:Ser/Thr protein kinase RdoA (MazF antagonist)
MTQAYEEGDVALLAEVARAAAGHWGLAAETTAELLNLSENATYLLRAPGADPVVLRVHRPGYSTPRQIASELAWVQALSRAGRVHTAPVLPAPNGTLVVEISVDALPEPRPCVLFGFCAGHEPAEDDLGAFERLGAIAARLHEHGRRWQPPVWFERRTWDQATTIGATPLWGRWQDGMGVGPEERALLGRLHDALTAVLDGYGKDPERYGLVHADMRLANLLIDGDATTVIDFDDCGSSWFLYDLASTLTFIEDRSDLRELIGAWLRGYRAVRPLSSADLAVVPTLIMLRRLLVLAWIGSHATTELARAEGIPYTRATCELAERYLAGTLDWMRA